MKTKSLGNILFIFFFVLTFALVFVFSDANATKPPKPQPQTQDQHQGQQQHQGQSQTAHGGFGEGGDSYSDVRVETGDVSAHSDSVSSSISEGSTAASSATTGSNSFSVNNESSPAEVVLVPNNNTASCQRVYGFGGGNRTGNAVFGIPYRDKQCDLEAAADDAFAQGNLALGWIFKCKQKNIKKAFGGKEWRTDGEAECLKSAGGVVALHERISVLESQKETLLIERKHDQERCTAATKRAHKTCVTK